MQKTIPKALNIMHLRQVLEDNLSHQGNYTKDNPQTLDFMHLRRHHAAFTQSIRRNIVANLLILRAPVDHPSISNP